MNRPFARLTALLTALLIALAIAPTALAQAPAPQPLVPGEVRYPMRKNKVGHAQSWDGRVLFQSFNVPNVAQGDGATVVRVFRPERIVRRPGELPVLPNECLSPLENKAGLLEVHFAAFSYALAPAPGFLQNPYPCERDGTPFNDPAGSSGYECYELMVVRPNRHGTPNEMGQMRIRRARVIVRNPRTRDAEVESCAYLGQWELLRVGSSNVTLNGIEPSMTFDGRLLIWQGHPGNDHRQHYIMYSWNPDPFAITGWSQPRTIVDMYYEDRDADVGGVPFHERFPLAKQPLRSTMGRVYVPGEAIRGAYPWVTLDGTDVFHTAAHSENLGAQRSAVAVVGLLSGYGVRPLDGPINPDRDLTTRTFVSSPGQTQGFWKPYRDMAQPPLPYTASDDPVVAVVQARNYGELDSSDALDGDHVLVLHMNEAISHTNARYKPSYTPDTSGHFNTGGLLGGAAFPQEYDGQDETVGRVGQAIYFPDGAAVGVADSPSLSSPAMALTVQLAVRRLQDVDRPLASKAGSWSLSLRGGRLVVSVSVGGAQRSTGPVGPPLRIGAWADVALRFDGVAGSLEAYVDGRQVGGVGVPAGTRLDATHGDLLLGPVGSPGGPKAVYLLDEVRVSRVARTPAEIARNAFVALPTQGWAKVEDLPLGLRASEARLPVSNQGTPEAVHLGKLLFFDPRLSGDGTISCATCHDPAKGFADGLALGRGIGGAVLTRNSPTVLNRLFSTRQFWDGRAADLEEQVLGPIENPSEMGSTVPRVVSFLGRHMTYRQLFQRVYGQSPDRQSLARALATFVRSLRSGDSDVDRFEAGDVRALSPSAQRGRLLFRGKARCTACHDGSNYTDEGFHGTASATRNTTDLGRFFSTGRVRHRQAFKTPTLRDVALTAPYLHDGSAPTLRDVVDRYASGGLRETDRSPEVRPLDLTGPERDDLVAFLEALTGRTARVAPPVLPR